MATSLSRLVKFDEHGLVPAIVQDGDGTVLMVAYMNREALRKTLRTGKLHYYSRSRRKLWLKGETSGHVQRLVSVALDCDGDTLLFTVKQTGGACHEGYRSCFFRVVKKGRLTVAGKRLFDPDKVYRT